MSESGPVFSIDRMGVGPADLPAQLPARARLLRVVAGPDRPDYCLAVVEEPLRHRTSLEQLRAAGVDPAAADPQMIQVNDDGSVDLLVFGLVLAARLQGEQLHAGMRDLAVGLAYVVDNTLLSDDTLDLGKALYVAVVDVTDRSSE
ncbi:hypothetical protein [Herbiconiux sp. A18JL235]|uniref:DUF3168 domain-containing protein n=1 Tax=Herbiconiux sp. A18JL235 TaxID=3152363 RepID=A0AB39BFR7_9MICO